MNLSTVRGRFGLTGKARATNTNVTGITTLGVADHEVSYSGTLSMFSVRAILAPSADFSLSVATNSTSGSTAWTAGNAQVETATAAGTITTAGNATVTVTAAGMTGSPKAITVAVALDDTAALWAAKVRTELAADADVSALFTVGGSSASITLTRLPLASYSVPDGNGSTTTLNVYAANDGTLNIALADDTSVGITEAASSANTTAGVASAGAKIYDGDGKDFEGVAVDMGGTVLAINISSSTALIIETTDGFIDGTYPLLADGEILVSNPNGIDTITTSAGSSTDLMITVVGEVD